MNKFIGREAELNALDKIYNQPGFQMTVIYDRRRVGKSTLIKEFIKKHKAVYFVATKAGFKQNLDVWQEVLINELSPNLRGLHFSDLEGLLNYIGNQAINKKIIIVIDEFPYLAEADKCFLSILQNQIDQQWSNTELHLILCGSSISFMEDEVLSEKSPLFGRRTSQLKISPFNYKESALFVPNYTYEEKAVCYGITGGIAKYLSFLDDRKSLDDNIIDLFFNKAGYLYEDPNNLLVQEFRNISLYKDIISAIANGKNKVNEIADNLHIDQSIVSHALPNLIETGIIVKEYAITDEKNSRKVQYHLQDGMFKFWYQFVQNGISAIELDKGNLYYQNIVKNKNSDYMGSIFEDMCAYYTLEQGLLGRFNCMITKVGKWWGVNPTKKESTDIDIVGLDTMKHQAIIGECKFKNSLLDQSVYYKLLERNHLIDHKYIVTKYLLFSKSGFTDELINEVQNSSVILISLEDMYK